MLKTSALHHVKTLPTRASKVVHSLGEEERDEGPVRRRDVGWAEHEVTIRSDVDLEAAHVSRLALQTTFQLITLICPEVLGGAEGAAAAAELAGAGAGP